MSKLQSASNLLAYDPYEIGAAGVPYTTQADFLAIPAAATGAMFDPQVIKKGYVRQQIGDGIHYVTSGAYDAMFVQSGSGVIVVDTPPLLGENMRRAIKEVTNEPVTHFIYSHWHKDHTGASGIWGPNVKYIGHTTTRDHLLRWPDSSPAPTETFETKTTLDVNGVKLELSYKGQNHCEGNSFIYAPKQKVLAAIDIITPGWTPFKRTATHRRVFAAGFRRMTGFWNMTLTRSSPDTSTAGERARMRSHRASIPTTWLHSRKKQWSNANTRISWSVSASVIRGCCGTTT